MRGYRLWLAALCAVPASLALPAAQGLAQNDAVDMEARQKAYEAEMRSLSQRLHRQTGDIAIPAAHATLNLGDDYYFLGPDESRTVIVEAWGNPPEMAENVLGMVFPANSDINDENGWGAVITYEQEGHVSDDDAASADFDSIMDDMRSGEDDRNQAREQQGYPPTHLIGWAERPAYDGQTHSVVWARDIQFGDGEDHSLNYDVRLLGRTGVLSLNMVSTMSHLAEVKKAAKSFADTASFDSGFAYADYVEGVDEKAGYGIAGLVAAGVGAAAAKKLGLLAVMLGFGKKFLVLIAVGFAAAWRWIKRLFGAKSEEAQAFEDAVEGAEPAESALEVPQDPPGDSDRP